MSKKGEKILDGTRYLSLDAAARSSPYTQEYLSYLARTGRLRARKIGRNWFVTNSEFEIYMREHARVDVSAYIPPPSAAVASVPSAKKWPRAIFISFSAIVVMTAISMAVVDLRGENSPASRNLLSAIGGTLTPGGAPAGTMHTLLEIYDSITGTFDSSAITADQNGSLIELLRYVEENMATGSGVGSDSLDFDEFANNMTVDVPTTIDATAGLTFSRADVTGNFEVGGTASVSALTVGGVAYNPSLYLLLTGGTLTGDLFGTDAFFSQNLEVSGLASVSSLRVGGVAYNPNLYLPLTGGTLTGDLFGTEASFSSTFGSGLTDCDTAASSKLLWNSSTGRFSCGVDTGSAGGSGGSIGVNTLGGTFQPTSSLSFAPSDFNVSYTTPQSIVRLDWINGPASRSANQTISGSWTFSNSTTGFTVTNNATVLGTMTVGSLTAPLINGDTLVSGNLDVAGRILSTYASASVGMEAGNIKTDTISSSSGTLTINAFTLGGNIIGNNKNITGVATFGATTISATTINAFTLGGSITGAGNSITGINRLTMTTGSASGTFEAAVLKAATLSSDTGTIAINASTAISGSATVSSNFEARGFASASALFGANLSDCTGAAQKLLWSGGLFSCGVDQSGSGGGAVGVRSNDETFSNVTSISFDAPDFDVSFPFGAEALVALDWINGPASRAANQTITGFWRFTAASTQFASVEVSNTASISGIVVDHGYLRMTNGSASNTFEAATIKATSIGGGGVLTINPTTRTQITGNASISANIEAAGYASSSRFFGAGLSVCASTEKLQWTSGFFTCVTDEIGSGGNVIGLREGTGTYTNISSISFDASMFDISFPDQGLVKLDWVNGPASHAAVNTWSALNSFTGGVSVSANFEVVGSRRVGINAGNITNSTLEVGGTASISGTTTLAGITYTWPTAQAVGSLQNNGSGVLSWSVPVGRTVTSNSLNFDELADALILDADTTIANNGFSLTIDQLRVTDSLRIAGFASASAYFGSALPNCSGLGEKLLYDSSTGQFSCALDQSGTGGGGGGVLGVRESDGTYVNKSSLSFDSGQFDVSYPDEALIKLDWGLSGPASRALSNIWEGFAEFVAGASMSSLYGSGLTNCTNPTGDKLLWNSATGLFSCASDQQGASSAGGWTDDGTTVRLSAATDNVGIGTATADGRLVIRQDSAADSFNVMDGATNVFTIIDGGNVGIGVTAPTSQLHVVGNGPNTIAQFASASGTSGLVVSKKNVIMVGMAANYNTIAFNAFANNGGALTAKNRSEIVDDDDLFMEGSLEVNGILDVAGNASVSGNFEGLRIFLDGVAPGGLEPIPGNPQYTFYNDKDTGMGVRADAAPNNLFFMTGGSAVMQMDENGNVQIGGTISSYTNNPGAYALNVIGTGVDAIAQFASASGVAGLVINKKNVIQVGMAANYNTLAYNAFANNGAGPIAKNRSEIDSDDDLFMEGSLEVNGILDVAGNASVSGNFEMTGWIYANGALTAATEPIPGNPQYTFSNDKDTGIGVRADGNPNNLFFMTGGVARMQMDENGYIQIGGSIAAYTNNPGAYALNVIGSGVDGIAQFASASNLAPLVISKKSVIEVGMQFNHNNVAYNAFANNGLSLILKNRSEVDSDDDLFMEGSLEVNGILDVGGNASVSGNFETSGNAIIQNISYSWPTVQGAANTYLKNDGAGGLTWTAITGKNVTSNSIDFDELTNAMTLDASTTVAQGAFNYGFTGNGNVGVGIAAPVIKLHIFSTADTDILRLEDSDGTCSHNPEAGGELVFCTSDERLKTTIRDAPSALTYLSGIRIRDYRVRSSGDRVTGVIAQELVRTRPEMVSSSSKGFLSVQQPNPWILVKAIQELDIKIASLSSGGLNIGAAGGQGGLLANIRNAFRTLLGIEFDAGIVKVDRVHAKGLELEGDDGEIYCVRIVGGDMVSNPGECTHAIATASSPVTPRQTTTPTPTISPTPTTAVSPTATVEPLPSATISTSPVASASESPTPESSVTDTPTPEPTETETPAEEETPAPEEVVPELPETGLPEIVKNHPLYAVIAIVIFGFITALFLKKKLRNDA